MERFVSLGASVNKKNRENYTALHFGKMKQIYAQIQILVEFSEQDFLVSSKFHIICRDTAPLD
jgi:hypothetical protein